ncbi:hypothetical protein Lal_00048762 [Lupinus albus]|nr:hypothetical protein Lal_00048762 [Lupinus albus]
MGRKERQKKKKTHSSDDDAEANEDLSLKIVQKALSKRDHKSNPVPDDVVVDGDVGAKRNEVVEVRHDDVLDGKSVIAVSDVGNEETTVERKKRRKKKKKVESEDQNVVIAEEQGALETITATEKNECAEVAKTDQISDNTVLRKLLRGPRYFDPPGSSWGTCYNCGEEGHAAVNCMVASKRKKPCFVCGSLEHTVKQCTKLERAYSLKLTFKGKECLYEGHNLFPQAYLPNNSISSSKSPPPIPDTADLISATVAVPGLLDWIKHEFDTEYFLGRDCFICKKGGHRAKDCPERHNAVGASIPSICLKCGISGHEMFSCKDDYSQDDLKEIQCYVCKRFGHLCCVDTTDTAQRQFSCYKCGQLGHTGLACSRLRSEATDASTPSLCYKCGEEGHFARECQSSVKPKKYGLSNTKYPRFQKENDYMGYRSAPHDMGNSYKKKRHYTEERENTTPHKSIHRGDWTTEHPGDFSPVKYKRNGWMSPVTPSTESTKLHSFSNGSHSQSSKSYNVRNAYETPGSRRSGKAFHHRFSASRFDNSSGDGSGRNYNWW